LKAKARLAALLGGLLLLSVVLLGGSSGSSALADESCSNEALRIEQHSTFLSDCRAYEQVSPVDKNGGDIMPYTSRTRAAVDGNAVEYASLAPFGDAIGTGVAVEHMALRGPDGWESHAITPKVDAGSLNLIAAEADTFYESLFSPNFERGVLFAARPVTNDPNVGAVANLYRRTDLRSPGPGNYDLVTECPVCASTATPLSPLPRVSAVIRQFLPWFAGASPDMEHVLFESTEVLTADTPPQDPKCGSEHLLFPTPSALFCVLHLYEWDHGELRLAGVLPGGEPADISNAGVGAHDLSYSPHVISDGSDGHSRVFFLQPTDSEGHTFSEIDPSETFAQLGFLSEQSGVALGNLYARVDHSQTILLNKSERNVPDAYSQAWYLDASANGERVFFSSKEALTEDATPGVRNVYMYDMTRPASAPDNLTLLNPPGTDSDGIWGLSDSGHYVYFAANGILRQWHDGVLHDIGPSGSVIPENISTATQYGTAVRQSRVTPDGQTLLFSTNDSSAFGGYDHGTCSDNFPCHELYVYSAATDQVVCASCNPSGAPATSSAVVSGGDFNGGARITSYENRGITDDGSKVFFSSADALVPQDINGKEDAYEYDVKNHTVSLISSGKDPADSWYLDSSADGRDVYFATRQRLAGWDTDGNYDLYDARTGGGFPEPPPSPAACSGGACQGALQGAPAPTAIGTEAGGRGNPHASHRFHCRRGHHRASRQGNARCVKNRRHPHRPNNTKRTNPNRRAAR